MTTRDLPIIDPAAEGRGTMSPRYGAVNLLLYAASRGTDRLALASSALSSRMMLAAAALLALAASAVALPVTSGSGCASSGTDPTFTTSCDKLAASVVCPNGLTGAVSALRSL